MARRRGRGPSQRQLRVGEVVRHALVEALARGTLRDPELAGVSITVSEVEMTPDLRTATAYVTPLGGADSARIVAALDRAAGHLRARIAATVEFKYMPRLVFRPDRTFEYARHIDDALRRPAVARDLGPPPGAGPGSENGA